MYKIKIVVSTQKTVNYWYDNDKVICNDPEGCLVALCQSCANDLEIADYAGNGDYDSICENCEASNNKG